MQILQEELKAHFHSPDEITGATVRNLPWLNACINESLRLLPPFNTRFAGRTSPGVIINNTFIAKGVQVFADIFTIQRSERYWPKASEFEPRRWIEAGTKSVHDNGIRSAFKPFLLGPRACIGRQMALLSLRLILAHLAFRYDFAMTNKDEFVWERDASSSMVWTRYKKVMVMVRMSSRHEREN